MHKKYLLDIFYVAYMTIYVVLFSAAAGITLNLLTTYLIKGGKGDRSKKESGNIFPI
jgi:hypothetical protein